MWGGCQIPGAHPHLGFLLVDACGGEAGGGFDSGAGGEAGDGPAVTLTRVVALPQRERRRFSKMPVDAALVALGAV